MRDLQSRERGLRGFEADVHAKPAKIFALFAHRYVLVLPLYINARIQITAVNARVHDVRPGDYNKRHVREKHSVQSTIVRTSLQVLPRGTE